MSGRWGLVVRLVVTVLGLWVVGLVLGWWQWPSDVEPEEALIGPVPHGFSSSADFVHQGENVVVKARSGGRLGALEPLDDRAVYDGVAEWVSFAEVAVHGDGVEDDPMDSCLGVMSEYVRSVSAGRQDVDGVGVAIMYIGEALNYGAFHAVALGSAEGAWLARCVSAYEDLLDGSSAG